MDAGQVGWAAAGGAALGAAAGARAQAETKRWKQNVCAADLNQLRAGLPLPPIPPPPPVGLRTERSMARCFVLGILGTGFAFWLAAEVILTAVALGAGAGVFEAVVSAGLFAFWAGVVGLIAGAFVGSALWLAEARARVRHFQASQRRVFWESREVLRGRLARDEWNAEQAWRLITSGVMGTDADAPPPLPG